MCLSVRSGALKHPQCCPLDECQWHVLMMSACCFPSQSYLQNKKTGAASINWTWLSPPFLWFTCFPTNDRLFCFHFILCWFFLYNKIKIKMTTRGRRISQANQLLMCSVLLCFENCLPLYLRTLQPLLAGFCVWTVVLFQMVLFLIPALQKPVKSPKQLGFQN